VAMRSVTAFARPGFFRELLRGRRTPLNQVEEADERYERGWNGHPLAPREPRRPGRGT
jgi:hypothetical protein